MCNLLQYYCIVHYSNLCRSEFITKISIDFGSFPLQLKKKNLLGNRKLEIQTQCYNLSIIYQNVSYFITLIIFLTEYGSML